MPDALERRLARMEDQLREILINLVTVENRQADMIKDVRAITAEIGGAPDPELRGDRETIRSRLHKLDNDRLAARTAAAALEAAKAANRQAWSNREKTALFLFASAAAVEGFLRIVGVGG